MFSVSRWNHSTADKIGSKITVKGIQEINRDREVVDLTFQLMRGEYGPRLVLIEGFITGHEVIHVAQLDWESALRQGIQLSRARAAVVLRIGAAQMAKLKEFLGVHL